MSIFAGLWSIFRNRLWQGQKTVFHTLCLFLESQEKDISSHPCSYEGAVGLSSGQWNIGVCEISQFQVSSSPTSYSASSPLFPTIKPLSRWLSAIWRTWNPSSYKAGESCFTCRRLCERTDTFIVLNHVDDLGVGYSSYLVLIALTLKGMPRHGIFYLAEEQG